MAENRKLKGPWFHRLVIIVLSIVLGVLLFWLLGFVTHDIGSLPGPDYRKIRQKYVDPNLVEKQRSLKEGLDDIKESIKDTQNQQAILKDSTGSLQNTINQLLSIQKQNLDRDRDLPDEQKQVLSESQMLFLENQKQYQSLSSEISELTKQQRVLEKELASVTTGITDQEKGAGKEYENLMTRHNWRVAAIKLSVVIPLFLITYAFFAKKRSGAYWPVVYAAFIAVFIRILMIVHEYFPRRYFKYIVILFVIGVVFRLLLYLIKRIISPKKDWLLRQYQESYDKGVCPVCSKPIRTGPLRYAVGGKRIELVVAQQGMDLTKQELYTCPACGIQLYQRCDKCNDIRHSLLPFCEHCGSEKLDWAKQNHFF
jgi:predicted RNA-binding Zn-ribbon protein involved in translation (DUF1610 family)